MKALFKKNCRRVALTSCGLEVKKQLLQSKNRRLQAFYEKAVLENFAKFGRKHLVLSLLINKVAVSFIIQSVKKDTQTRAFLLNFHKLSKTPKGSFI